MQSVATAIRELPAIFFLLLFVFLAALLESFGLADSLWVLSSDKNCLAYWLVFVALDFLLQGFRAFPAATRARLVFWCAGVLFFSARGSEQYFMGTLFILIPAALWVFRKHDHVLAALAVLVCAVFALRVGYFHNSFALRVAAFYFGMRLWAWSRLQVEGKDVSFMHTMEFFLSPAFWIGPSRHALVLPHAFARQDTPDFSRAIRWLLAGLFHAVLFSLAWRYAAPHVSGFYLAGVGGVTWWNWASVPLLMLALVYLEFARTVYFASGAFALGGRVLTPGIDSPWRASSLRNLLRRTFPACTEFHFELVYLPLARRFGDRMPAKAASTLAMLTALVVGMTSVFFLVPTLNLASFILALAFGACVWAHFEAAEFLERRWYVGWPLTWGTMLVFGFWMFPVFVLGWGPRECLRFLGIS